MGSGLRDYIEDIAKRKRSERRRIYLEKRHEGYNVEADNEECNDSNCAH